MELKGKKIGVFIEADYYENEIFYYQFRFPEEGAEVYFLTRLWGQEKLIFKGHDYKIPIECTKSFENMTDEELKSYSAIIIPSGYVSDRLRYTEDVHKIPPACEFLKRVFKEKTILKGIICHGMWLMSPISDLIKGRKAVVHNNLLGDAKNYGIEYVDQDVVVDDDLVTARTGMHCNVFAQKIIELLSEKQIMEENSIATFSHVALSCKDPIKIEKFYTNYFNFKRARVYAPGDDQVVMIKSGNVYLELFRASKDSTVPPAEGAGPEYPAWKHICFLVDNLDKKLEEIGDAAKITLGPKDMSEFIHGMRVCWIADPEGNIVELNQGYKDEKDPPPLDE